MDFQVDILWRKCRLQEAVNYLESQIGRILRIYQPRTEVLSREAVFQLVKNTLMAEQEDTIERLYNEVENERQEKQYLSELHQNELRRMRDFYENIIQDLRPFEKQSGIDFNFQNSSGLQYATPGKPLEIDSKQQSCQPSAIKFSGFRQSADKVHTIESEVYGHDGPTEIQDQVSSSIFGKIHHLPSNRLAIEFYGNKIANTQRPEGNNKNTKEQFTNQQIAHFDKLDSSLRETLNDLKASLRCKYITGRVRPTETARASQQVGFSNTFDRIPLSMTGNVTPFSHSRVDQSTIDKYAYTSGRLVRASRSPGTADCYTVNRRMPPLEKPLRSPSLKPVTLR